MDQTAQWDSQWKQLHPTEGVRPVGYHGEDTPSNTSGGGGIPGYSSSNVTSPVDWAKQLNQFSVQQNQPAISTLQGQIDPLKDRYSKLLESIKGQGSVATNAQTLATSNEMGRRGILPSSGLFEQQMASSLLPVTTQYAGLEANAGLSENQDIMGIQNAIAALQRGDPNAAITGASNIYGVQQQASNLQSQLQNALQVAKLQNQYFPIGADQSIYNAQSGSFSSSPINNLSSLFNGNTGNTSQQSASDPWNLDAMNNFLNPSTKPSFGASGGW